MGGDIRCAAWLWLPLRLGGGQPRRRPLRLRVQVRPRTGGLSTRSLIRALAGVHYNQHPHERRRAAPRRGLTANAPIWAAARARAGSVCCVVFFLFEARVGDGAVVGRLASAGGGFLSCDVD